jgi:hypothetical protein
LLVVELEANFLVSDFSTFPGTVFFRNTFLFLTIVSSLLQPSPSSESLGETSFHKKISQNIFKTSCYYRFHRSILWVGPHSWTAV